MSTSAFRGLRSSLRRVLRRDGVGAAEPRRSRVTLEQADTVLYAIGDVHGCYDELRRLEDILIADGRQFDEPKHIVMLGDYVDRGPGSARVIEHLSGSSPDGFGRTCLCGNHDAEMLRALETTAIDTPWMHLGSDATIHSYGMDASWLRRLHARDPGAVREQLLASIPAHHVDFLRGLPVMAVADDIVFVHAGLRPGVPLADQVDSDLLWIRQPFLDAGPRLPVWVVHGHTPILTPAIKQERIGIDTAAFKTGRLSAVRIWRREVMLFQTGSAPAGPLHPLRLAERRDGSADR